MDKQISKAEQQRTQDVQNDKFMNRIILFCDAHTYGAVSQRD